MYRLSLYKHIIPSLILFLLSIPIPVLYYFNIALPLPYPKLAFFYLCGSAAISGLIFIIGWKADTDYYGDGLSLTGICKGIVFLFFALLAFLDFCEVTTFATIRLPDFDAIAFYSPVPILLILNVILISKYLIEKSDDREYEEDVARLERMDDSFIEYVRSLRPTIKKALDAFFKNDLQEFDALLDSLHNPPKAELTIKEIEKLEKKAQTTMSPEQLNQQFTLVTIQERYNDYLPIVAYLLKAKFVAKVYENIDSIYSNEAAKQLKSLDKKLFKFIGTINDELELYDSHEMPLEWLESNNFISRKFPAVSKLKQVLKELEAKESLSTEELQQAKSIFRFIKLLDSPLNEQESYNRGATEYFGFKNEIFDEDMSFLKYKDELSLRYAQLEAKALQQDLIKEFETGNFSDSTQTIIQLAGCSKRDKVYFAFNNTKVYELSKKESVINEINNKLDNPDKYTTIEDGRLIWKPCRYKSLAALVKEAHYNAPIGKLIGNNYICITKNEILFSNSAEFNKVVSKNISSIYPFAEGVLVYTDGERRPNYLIITDYANAVINAIQKSISK